MQLNTRVSNCVYTDQFAFAVVILAVNRNLVAVLLGEQKVSDLHRVRAVVNLNQYPVVLDHKPETDGVGQLSVDKQTYNLEQETKE